MKKLMKYLTEINTMIGRQIKALVAVSLLVICTACPNIEDPLQYDLVLDNRTAAELEVKFYNNKDGAFGESYLLSPFTIKKTSFSVGVFENEVVVEEFFNSWYGKTRVFKNDSLMIEWNSPAYYGGSENHFYNINAWMVENSHPSSFIDGTFTFTIYPEDLEQHQTK